MIVKPAPGLKVRDPATKRLLPEEGITVPDGDILWTRALNDGDVVLGVGAPSANQPAKTSGSDKQ
jgi:hypothetical protein